MSKVRTYGILCVLAIALVAMMLPASANLVGTQFGFPTIVQNGATTAFNRDTAVATDTEAVAISFPIGESFENDLPGTAELVGFGSFGIPFPTIAQTVAQTQALTHTDFATTSESAAFAYPFVGVGGVPIPGFGFGF